MLRSLGKGGFGQVYLGEHIHLKTHAAIKLLLDADDEQKDAFLQEALNIASLKHPHILPVLDFGVKGSTLYLVMTYAAHGNLHERHLRGTKVPLDQVVGYTKQIAEALQYAHEARLIHRDVKPANVLVDEQDTILLSDFGIATVAHSASSMPTIPYAGTPSYTAPEQFQGKPVPASDQYALAIMVYEWLCGQLPYQGSPTAVVMQHLNDPIPSLRRHNATLSPDIEAVVHKAMAKDPNQRFTSIKDFAAALEQASLPTVEETLLAQSLPLPPTVLAPDVTQEPGNLTTPVVETHSSTSVMTPPPNPTISHKPTTRRAIFVRSGTAIVGIGIVGAFIYVQQPAQGQLFIYQGHSDHVNAVAWSANGKRIASGSDDQTVRVWDVNDGNNVFIYRGHSNPVLAVAWSPDGTRLVSGSLDNTAQVWSDRIIDGGRGVTYRRHSRDVKAVAWSPDGKRIASGSFDQTVQVWNADNGYNVSTYKGHSNAVRAVAWSPDGQRIASGADDNSVQVWNANNGSNLFPYEDHNNHVNAVAWSPDGKRIASGSDDRTVQVWSASNGSHMLTYTGHTDIVSSVAWSPDGQYIASGSADETVQVWNVSSGRLVFTYTGHDFWKRAYQGSGPVKAVAWSPNGQRITSGSDDYTVQVWSPR